MTQEHQKLPWDDDDPAEVPLGPAEEKASREFADVQAHRAINEAPDNQSQGEALLEHLQMMLDRTLKQIETDVLDSAEISPGLAYRIAQVSIEHGKKVEAIAREAAETLVWERGFGKEIISSGVEFKWRNPSTRHNLDVENFIVMRPHNDDNEHLYDKPKPNSALIRKALPPESYPNLYKTTEVKGGLVVRVLPEEIK